MNRKNIIYLLTGLILGILLCSIFLPLLTGKGKEGEFAAEGKARKEAPEEKDAKEEAHILESSSNKAAAATTMETASVSPVSEWSSKEIYLGGDKVLYGGRIYRAKWWTTNELPGSCDVWEDTLEVLPTEGAEKPPVETDVPPAGPVNSRDDGFKVVAYYPNWSGEQFNKLQFDVVTHVVYAFAIPNGDGTLKPLENPDLARKLIAEAHSHGVKALLAVGGWSYNDTPLEPSFDAATKDQKTMEKFVDSILKMCNTYGFDGIDMDWEHPREDKTKSQYEALMLSLADRLHAQGKLLTSAVISGATADGNIYYDAKAHTDSVLNAVDWIHVMAYDGGDGERHSSYDFAVNCGAYWKDTRKLPSSKVVLGVPFYGRPGWAAYESILSGNPEAWNKDVSNFNGMEAHYNGMSTIEKKTRYAKQNLGGIMIWEITQDTDIKEKSLLSAVRNGLK